MNKFFLCVVVLFAVAVGQTQADDKSLPANIDGGLRRVVPERARGTPIRPPLTTRENGRVQTKSASLGIRDQEKRVLVRVNLNVNQVLGNVETELMYLGGKVTAENAGHRKGVFSAFVPP